MEAQSVMLWGTTPETSNAIAGIAAELGLRVDSNHAAGTPGTASGGIAVVSVERDADAAFRVAASLARGGTRVVVQGPAKDPDVILRALRAGAQEFVVAGDAEGLRRALHVRPAGAEVRGRVVAVYGAKGGLGATTLATNIAGSLQRRGARACIADLDPALGAVTSALDVAPAYTIAELVANMHRLDRQLLDDSVPRHSSGLAVVAPGEDVEAAERVDSTAIASLLGFLRRHYDAVVIDGLRGFDERTVSALDASDRVILVLTQEVAAVRNAQRCLELFKRLGYAPEKVQVVLNRFNARATITPAVVEETLELTVSARVANDFAAVSRSVTRGSLVAEEAPRSSLARDVDALAAGLGVEGIEEGRPRSIFGRLFRSKVHRAAR